MGKQEKVLIDFEACKECGYCRIVCPKNVFEKGDEFNAKGYRAFAAVNPQGCIGCMRCFYACPDFAITVNKGGDTDEKSV
ncbi:MAG: ferredoxin family protein [Oscillospiraceae bacterium]